MKRDGRNAYRKSARWDISVAERAAQPIRLTHLQSGHSLTRKDNTRMKPAHSRAGFIKKKSG